MDTTISHDFTAKNELSRKAVLITGASHRFGRALVVAFDDEGCSLSSCARSSDEINCIAEEIISKGGKAIAITADVIDEVYSASKFAVVGFSQALRQEVKECGIKVTEIYPGGMKTRLFDSYKQNLSGFVDTE